MSKISKWEAAKILDLLILSSEILNSQEKKGFLNNDELWNFHSKKMKKEFDLRIKSMVKIIEDEKKV
jgi:hypothetical protein